MYRDLTRGPIARSLVLFALPMMAGNLLQQFYNIADTLIVGRALGTDALAAVGSAYTLMTFLTSILLGLSMGSGALFSIYRGRGDETSLRSAIAHAFGLILLLTLALNAAVYAFLNPILHFLRVPAAVWGGMREYLLVVFAGLVATSVYNYLACLLRALGNSAAPLVFLGVSALLNVGLDLLFVPVLGWGIAGAAWATVIAQYVSAAGMLVFVIAKCKILLSKRSELHLNRSILGEIFHLSSLTCAQQSVMNFGILMVQGLVNSFGATVMAAFAAGEVDVLVSTTVIEVGVDVPNASLMVVEDADRFGLSQLHQLRGRVGRGEHPSYCVLLSDNRNELTRKRLKTLASTTDGFAIAEEDLKLRGPGDFFGARQHGLPQLKLASLEGDMRLLHQAQAAAQEVLARDPNLTWEEHAPLRRRVEQLFRENRDIFN